jgi:hypothetical protein
MNRLKATHARRSALQRSANLQPSHGQGSAPPSAPFAGARARSCQEARRLLRPVLVRIVFDCGACREIAPEALVFLTRRSDIVFAGWASWRNTARHGSDAEATHENHQFRCAGCRSTANRGCVPGHLLRCAARCRAPSERGHRRASGAQIECRRAEPVRPCSAARALGLYGHLK